MGEIMRAYVMIGPSGSGKTTYIRDVLKIVPNQQVVCPDDIRREWAGFVSDSARDEVIQQLTYQAVEEALSAGKVVIFDAPNVKELDRIVLLEQLRKIMGEEGYIKGIWLKTPLDECKKRNANRDVSVSERKIERMHRQLEATPPRLYEGFSQIYAPAW